METTLMFKADATIAPGIFAGALAAGCQIRIEVHRPENVDYTGAAPAAAPGPATTQHDSVIQFTDLIPMEQELLKLLVNAPNGTMTSEQVAAAFGMTYREFIAKRRGLGRTKPSPLVVQDVWYSRGFAVGENGNHRSYTLTPVGRRALSNGYGPV